MHKYKITKGRCIDCDSTIVLVVPRTGLPAKRCPNCFLDVIQEAMLLAEAEEILTTGKFDDNQTTIDITQ